MGNYGWQSKYNQVTYDINYEAYSYNQIMVIEHEGEYYVGTDSGCSCPSPFENYNGLGDMTGPMTKEEAITCVRDTVITEEDGRNKWTRYRPKAELEEYIELIRSM